MPCLTKGILALSKLELVTSATELVTTWLLGINLACSNLASNQAKCQAPQTYCFTYRTFLKESLDCSISPTLITPPLRSTVVRASDRGAGCRGSIPDRVTPKT